MQCLHPCLNLLCWHVCTTKPWSVDHLSVHYSPHITEHKHTHTSMHSITSIKKSTSTHFSHKFYITWLTVELTQALQSLCKSLLSHHSFTAAVFSVEEMGRGTGYICAGSSMVDSMSRKTDGQGEEWNRLRDRQAKHTSTQRLLFTFIPHTTEFVTFTPEFINNQLNLCRRHQEWALQTINQSLFQQDTGAHHKLIANVEHKWWCQNILQFFLGLWFLSLLSFLINSLISLLFYHFSRL